MFDIIVYICGHGITKDFTVKSLDRLHTNSQFKFEVRFGPKGQMGRDALIGRARSVAATDFLRFNDAPYMVFVDSDIVFAPEDIEKLYRGMVEGHDILAGAYSLADGMGLAIRAWEQTMTFDNTIQDIEYVSTGFMGISRKALETIRDKLELPLLHKGEWCECWPFFESGRYMPQLFYISEDWDFPLSPETKILLNDFSWKELGNITIGDTIISRHKKANHPRWVYAQVADKIKADLESYRVITEDGEVVTSANHPLLATSYCNTSFRWMTPRQLQVGYHLAKPIDVIDSFQTDRDYMEGYLKGIWTGDGTIRKYPEDYATLEMTDVEAIKRAFEFTQKLGLESFVTEHPVRNSSTKDNSNWKATMALNCKNGISAIKAKALSSENMAKGFLAGLYDAEGSYHSHIRIAMRDTDAIKTAELALKKLGVTHTITTRPDNLEEINISKFEDSMKFWQLTHPAITRKVTITKGQRGNQSMYYQPKVIKAIEPVGKRELECLTTTEGSFIANGFISHNCNKAREAGLRVYFHSGCLVGHIKDSVLDPKAAIKNTSTEGTSPILSRCMVHEALVSDLIAYLNVPAAEVMDLLNAGPTKVMIDEWTKWKKDGGSTEGFYKETKTLLLDQIDLDNRTHYWQSRIAPLKNETGKTVLDIGCGIGSASLFLGTQRNKVMGYDINQSVLDFANFRKTKFGLINVIFTNQMPEDLTQFDLVMAIDVLEHIEDLHSFLLALKGMKSDAKFYHFDSFFDRHPHPQHYKRPPEFNDWLKEAGFTVFDETWAIKK